MPGEKSVKILIFFQKKKSKAKIFAQKKWQFDKRQKYLHNRIQEEILMEEGILYDILEHLHPAEES